MIDQATGVPFFTMKLVQGVSFERWLRDPSRPLGSTERLEEGLEIFVKVCDAVAYAHHRGVIHRDLKPENIMVGGFARLTWTEASRGSRARALRREDGDGRSYHRDAGFVASSRRGNWPKVDERFQFSGGAVLYQIVSGKTPFGDLHDIDEVMRRSIAARSPRSSRPPRASASRSGCATSSPAAYRAARAG